GRMQGLAYIPDPLWWLLGAIVSFYFGAREMHHFRTNTAPATPSVTSSKSVVALTVTDTENNAALAEWAAQQ
ncbi:MAG: 3TM-type holin, partial [Alphaproteobacteria bacterium]